MKDTIKTSVPIRKDLIATRKAHSEYQLHLEDQRRQKAAELHKAVELEKELEEKRQLKNKKDTPLAAKRRRESLEQSLNKNTSKPRQRNS